MFKGVYVLASDETDIRIVYIDIVDKDQNIENIVDSYLAGKEADVWMGEFYVGRLQDIGLLIVRWRFDEIDVLEI